MNHDDSEGKTSEALLIFEVSINREQKVKSPCCQLQQFTVFRTGPAYLSNGLNRVARKLLAQGAWNTLVKQHAHRQLNGPLPAREQL
jgi:hypothetical protein